MLSRGNQAAREILLVNIIDLFESTMQLQVPSFVSNTLEINSSYRRTAIVKLNLIRTISTMAESRRTSVKLTMANDNTVSKNIVSSISNYKKVFYVILWYFLMRVFSEWTILRWCHFLSSSFTLLSIEKTQSSTQSFFQASKKELIQTISWTN